MSASQIQGFAGAAHRMRRKPAGVAAALVLLFVLSVVIAAPVLAPHDPYKQNIIKRLDAPSWLSIDGGGHILGTDRLGRDLLSRVMYGGRVTLMVASLATVVSAVIGVTLGVLAGYYGGRWADLIMGLADTQHAFPFIVLAIAIVAVLGADLLTLVIVLGIWGWASFARVVRAEVLVVREREFVQAARALGASDSYILFRHILPATLPVIIVMGTVNLSMMIIGETALSFLGMGVQPPVPSWGNIAAEGRDYLDSAWWLATVPGIAIVITVLSINAVGDMLREVLDPQLAR